MAERKVRKLFEGKLDHEQVASLPTEIQLADDDTKLEFYEARKVTGNAYLTRARVIDNYYLRYANNPQEGQRIQPGPGWNCPRQRQGFDSEDLA